MSKRAHKPESIDWPLILAIVAMIFLLLAAGYPAQ